MRPLLLALFLIPCVAHAQAPRVVATAPAAHAITAPAAAPIELAFDAPLDPATVTAAAVRVFGRWSGPAAGTLAVEDGGTRVVFTPAEPFFAGEQVTVQVAKTVRSAGGTPLAAPFTLGFWVRAAATPLALEEVDVVEVRRPGEGLIISYGAYAGDLDDDGYSDLAVPNEAANDLRVFLNDGAGGYDAFTIFALPDALVPSTNEGGDYDEDGHIDLAVGNIGNDRVSVLLGDGAGGFEGGASYPSAQAVRGLCVLDLDGDGHDDLVTANRTASTLTLLFGRGDGTFEAPVPVEANVNGETACAAADADGDGVQDLFIGGIASREIALLLGDGDGGLTFSTKVSAPTSPWMLAAGDVDGDGDADVVAAGSSNQNVAVVLGDGAGGLAAPVLYAEGGFPIAIDLGDLDGDGDLDMMSSNFSSASFELYENLGDGTFATSISFPTAEHGSCAVFHDRDGDGDLDVTGVDEGADLLYLYTNPAVPTATGDAPAPARLALDAPSPNPARGEVTLRYVLPAAAPVRLDVLDLRGRTVAVVADGFRNAGPHTLRWAADLPGGHYLLRLRAGAETATRRLVLTR